MFDGAPDRVRKCFCCCADFGWNCVKWVFGCLSLGLVIMGIVVLFVSGGFDGSQWFKDMVAETGITEGEVSRIADKMIYIYKTTFLCVGAFFLLFGLFGFLVSYCQKCIIGFTHCTCIFLLFIFTFIVAIPVCAVWGLEKTIIDDFCVQKYDKFPHQMGSYFKEHPNENSDNYDQYMQVPISVLCSDACPCVDIDKSKWSKEIQESMANPGFSTPAGVPMAFPVVGNRTWNFKGDIKTMDECIAHLKKPTTAEKFTCFAMKTVNSSEFVRRNKKEEVKAISSDCATTTALQ